MANEKYARIQEEEMKSTLVRKFSDKWNEAEPGNVLALGVAVVSRNAELPETQEGTLESLYCGSAVLVKNANADLEKSSATLRLAWDGFLKDKSIEKDKRSDYTFMPQENCTDIFAEFTAHIQNAVEEWKSRKGKAHNFAISCCDTLSSHSNLFSTIPNESLYCSLFCGVLKTLIKAGANYKRIAIKLDESMKAINEQVKLCKLDHRIMQTEEIQALILKLYSQVFKFLELTMRYFSSKFTRFRDAFNENSFEDNFGSLLENITATTDLIRKRAELGSRAEIRDVHFLIKDIDLSIRYMLSKQTSLDAKVDYLMQSHEREARARKAQEMSSSFFGSALFSIGNAGQRFLIQDAAPEAALYLIQERRQGGTFHQVQYAQDIIRAAPSSAMSELTDCDSISENGETQDIIRTVENQGFYTSHEIRKNAGIMKDLTLRNPLPLQNDELPQDGGILPEPTVVSALQTWASRTDSQILWINGTSGEKQRVSFSNLAQVVVSNARDFDVHTLYYACDPYADEYSHTRNDADAHKHCLLDLVLVLISQLVNILPDYTHAEADLSAARFDALSEDYTCLPAATVLLRDLLEFAPPILIVVIDGVDRLSHPLVEQDATEVLRMLFSYTENPPEKAGIDAAISTPSSARAKENALKILVTTVTPCEALPELYTRYEGSMELVSVPFQKWHQYGKGVDLFM